MRNLRTSTEGGAQTAASAPVEVIEGVAALMLPLYSEADEDRPDRVLSGYPDPKKTIAGLEKLIDVLFPGGGAADHVAIQGLEDFLKDSLSLAWSILLPEIERALPFRRKAQSVKDEAADQADSATARDDAQTEAQSVLAQFVTALPSIRAAVIEDVRAAYDGDPAALSYAEVQLAYPGLRAITSHRLAHELYKLNVPLLPRIMSEWTHTQTGCDIHPGATIGRGFFVDHPTGVVIGETAQIGAHVKLYQGVTIGAKSFPLDEQGRPIKHIKRHPTVEDHVVCYSNATILGGDTVIGAGSTIGGNVFLMESVPPGSFVVRSDTGGASIKPRK